MLLFISLLCAKRHHVIKNFPGIRLIDDNSNSTKPLDIKNRFWVTEERKKMYSDLYQNPEIGHPKALHKTNHHSFKHHKKECKIKHPKNKQEKPIEVNKPKTREEKYNEIYQRILKKKQAKHNDENNPKLTLNCKIEIGIKNKKK